MKLYGIMVLAVLAAGIFSAGCTQAPGTGPAANVPATATPAGIPGTPAIALPETTAPQQVVTILHQVSLVRNVRDSELLFTLQVPVEWNLSTYRLDNPDNAEGLAYQTDLRPQGIFYIQTYTASRSQDQSYRDRFRKWTPAPAETTVTINGITYDRFESVSGGRVNVAYVARKGSANERGYASVIVFSADAASRFEKEDFETVVSTFRYFTAASSASVPGDEIPRVNPPFETAAGLSSRTGGSESLSTGSGSGCSRCGT